MKTAAPDDPRRAPALSSSEAAALASALEQEVAQALGAGAANPALARVLAAIRARAAAMFPAAGPPPPPAALAKLGAEMGKDLDALEDLLEALQLFPARPLPASDGS
ncbi:hypothetical protein WME89_26065 [Sorangium sp. So ce321]|uniref:hypothetical protein n=1 Tax=Sorangium sp. So ce321 TaxID=3133300 RepID=UPI003F5FC207